MKRLDTLNELVVVANKSTAVPKKLRTLLLHLLIIAPFDPENKVKVKKYYRVVKMAMLDATLDLDYYSKWINVRFIYIYF